MNSRVNTAFVNKVRGRKMMKTYISSLLVVLLAGAQTIRAQGSLDDVMAQLDAADGGSSAPAMVETAQPASVDEEAAEMASEEEVAG
jgi:hypothetical protein